MARSKSRMPTIERHCRPGSAEIPTGERAVQCEISAPFAGFLSVGLFGRHERKFKRHFKGLFLQAYRQFESPLVRQQVCPVIAESALSGIISTVPRLSRSKNRTWPMREQTLPIFLVECMGILRRLLCQWLCLRRSRGHESSFRGELSMDLFLEGPSFPGCSRRSTAPLLRRRRALRTRRRRCSSLPFPDAAQRLEITAGINPRVMLQSNSPA